MGEAIALSSPSGHMSKRARKVALARLAAKLFPKEANAVSIESIAGQVRKEMNPNLDNFEVGEEVIARFTNSGRIREFRGKVLGRTKNYWKVEALTTPYENEQPGRMYHIATLESRIYSANNCLRKIQ
jgi:hypothetical protein